MKRKLMIFLALAAVLVMGGTAGATLAYLNGGDRAVNELQVGTVEVGIRENDKDNNGFKPPSSGSQTAPKKVEIVNPSNSTNVPIYVRAAIVPVFRTGSGSSLSIKSADVTYPQSGETDIVIRYRDGKSTFHAVLASDWESKWLFIDGFFYYREAIQPGVKSSPLLEKVDRVAGDDGWECLQIEVAAEGANANTTPQGSQVSNWPVKVGAGGKLVAN